MTPEWLTEERLAEIRERSRGPFSMKNADRWGVMATIDRLDLLAEVDRLRAQVEDFAGLLNRAAGEAEQHALANDGCVPGAAYRDLGDELRRVEAERDRLRAQVAAIEGLLDYIEARDEHIAYQVRAALASRGEVQP